MSEVPLQAGVRDWVSAHRYRVTSLIRNSAPLGPCSSPMPRDLW